MNSEYAQSDADDDQDLVFVVGRDTLAYVISPLPGAWATNQDGVVAFESPFAVARWAVELNGSVERITLGELLDICHADGTPVVWVRQDGPAIVLQETLGRWLPSGDQG